ncbi:phage minor capsid protein [Streptomyces sp. NPDC006632]|uniref:phage minor capsid protein n=1 Tax=Streptomyces sp. NPDC006632 TaxID=3157182 RepID=UPI0033B7960E
MPDCNTPTADIEGVVTPQASPAPGPPRAIPPGYEAGQRQREIERNIRKHKAREPAAVTPEAQQAARAKVRQWQGAMRDHLTAHPDLRRLRHREQPGASNLPRNTAPAPGEFTEAARIRSGDARTPREMSDQQLADAMRTGVLDERDRARIEVEADRRDRDDLLARLRPGGRLAADLTSFSDSELARVFTHLDDADGLRIMTEMDRPTSPPAYRACAPIWSACPTPTSPRAPAASDRTLSANSPSKPTAATCSPACFPMGNSRASSEMRLSGVS